MSHEPQPTQPNTGRMFDYGLGGQHHYPIDVAAARAFEAVFDDFPRVFRALPRTASSPSPPGATPSRPTRRPT